LCGTDQCICKEKGNSLADESQQENDWHAAKVHTNGTIAHTTAIFGFTLAGLVIQDILKKINAE
jgi:tRNA A37 threonylcarbamoyladenosine dehydratase